VVSWAKSWEILIFICPGILGKKGPGKS